MSFESEQEVFTKAATILGHNTNLNKFKGVEIYNKMKV